MWPPPRLSVFTFSQRNLRNLGTGNLGTGSLGTGYLVTRKFSTWETRIVKKKKRKKKENNAIQI